MIQFPGVNCEYETVRAAEKAGLRCGIFRWNEPSSRLRHFDGYVLPGGFSYEDRVRAGAIAASEDILEVIADESSKGKPVLGICNGAQILVEAGLVPGTRGDEVEVGLAPNRGVGRPGYYSTWIYLRVSCPPERCAVTMALEPGEILPMPIAHAQGRFISQDQTIFESLEAGDQVVFKYCKASGELCEEFPYNPNGSTNMIAAICNPRGNVVAMMPHPERATWLRQIPMDLPGEWSQRRRSGTGKFSILESDGPGAYIFTSMRKYIEECL